MTHRMDGSSCTGRIPARLLATAVLLGTLALSGTPIRAHDETPEVIEGYLHGLVDDGAITETQHHHIDRLYFAGRLPQLHAWVEAQEIAGRITGDTHLYLDSLLDLSEPDPTAPAAAASNYTGNGNVTLLGRSDVQPPSPYYGDSPSTGTLYNGIWGYAAGSREYALQTNSSGLHIIDVTDPAASFRVQFIAMSGGRIWRDVDTYTDSGGTTYAYVGAQAGGNFWVVNLSYLSDALPDGVDSNPIPPAGIADRGRTNYGHTISVNRELGLLFLNTANSGSTLGCQILDLEQNPFDPPVIGGWSGSGHDCHDSFSRGDVPGTGGKDLLYSADGYSTRYRVVDITSIRLGGAPTLLGESVPVSGIYAHSNSLDDDSRYLYAFEEFNVRDIGVYDVSDPATPTLVTTFQYSGDATGNARVHNGQVRGKYLLAAYYDAGLRVFDISNPANPVEVGKYETWRDPDGDGTFNQAISGGYNGAWNVHAFLPSGNVLVSDMKSGTFIVQIDPVAEPGAASGLSATPGDGQAALIWAAADGATGYSVHRGTTSGGPYAIVASSVVGTSFVDTGLANGTTYFYVVTATNAEGEGATSNEVAVNPPALELDTVTPAAGLSSGGQEITLTGAFATLSAVTVGGASVPWSYSGGTSAITFTTPPHAAGAVDIGLSPTTGGTLVKANAFAFLPTTFTDDVLVAGVTPVRSQHVIELREAIDALRAIAGMGSASWTDPALTASSSPIRAVHLLELRTYLEGAASVLGYPAATYSDPSLGAGFLIRRVHVEELRQRIRDIAD
ncbi:MAG: choice-of-anchor B family protein [Acidobacteria bacterium]|nr:choice-of-anchor B family protein [Acidobacteriota bacterium]